MVPMLDGPDEILPQHAVVPIAGTMDKIQKASMQAQDAVDRGEQSHNPLDDGDIIIPPAGSSFIFVPGPVTMGQPADPERARSRIDQSQLMPRRSPRVQPFPHADLTFDLSDLVELPDINENITQPLVQPVAVLDVEGLQLSVAEADNQEAEREEQQPAKKAAVTVTYERRCSERLKHKMDGVRVDSVERASHRKATSAGESDSSVGSASTRRRKTRRLPDIDINKFAPMPVTASPPETSMDRLQELQLAVGT
jgi:hypothetical protein